MSEYIEIEEACKVLHLKLASIRKLIQQNKIPYYKPFKKVLFKKNELLNYMESKRIPAEYETRNFARFDILTERVNNYAKSH